MRGGSFFLYLLLFVHLCEAQVFVGADLLLQPPHREKIIGKRIALASNRAAVTKEGLSLVDLLLAEADRYHSRLVALFSPEHGFFGEGYADEAMADSTWKGIPLYSLHGQAKRPSQAQLRGVDLLIFDLQDVGVRSYTFASTLFYLIEEAARAKIPVLVLDRPNPINGVIVDGPLLEKEWRSFVGYLEVPLCHGMTMGELALYFNREYHIGGVVEVVPMQGWRREMSYQETGLLWIPTSPHIPELSNVFGYATTGVLGELSWVSIGVGYSLPFRLVGAPWIRGEELAEALQKQKLPGVLFHPFTYRPFFGKYAKETCQGVLLLVTDLKNYLPVTTQLTILGILKTLYPAQAQQLLQTKKDWTSFHRAWGTRAVWQIFSQERYPTWQLRGLHQKERMQFIEKRKRYLLYKS